MAPRVRRRGIVMSETLIRALATFPDQFAAHYALIPGSHKNWAPASWDGVPSEPLTAIEQVCHVRDIEIDGYQTRFRRALAEVRPTLPSIDTEGLARERSYATANADAALSAFRAARAQTVELLSQL